MHILRLQRLLCIYCPGHAGVSGNKRADRLASAADFTSGLQLGRAEVLRGLRNFLNIDRPEHQSINSLKEVYGLFRRWRQSAAENELSWNTAPLMAETTNARSVRFLTMPIVGECCAVIHCGAFASLSILYGALDSILFTALCSYENSSSPPHSILDNHIPVSNTDRKLHHGRITLVLEAKLESSNVTNALRQFLKLYLFGNSGVIHACNVSKPPQTQRRWDIVIECQLFLALLYLGFYLAI